MMGQIVVLWTDALVYALVLSGLLFIVWARRQVPIRQAWQRVLRKRLAVISLIILSFYVGIGLLDSIHFQRAANMQSVFDKWVAPLGTKMEKTYSAPFALRGFIKEPVILADGQQTRILPRLYHVDPLIHTPAERRADIQWQLARAFFYAIGFVLMFSLLAITAYAAYCKKAWRASAGLIIRNQTLLPIRLMLITLGVVSFFVFCGIFLASHYHILGTDKVGQDVFYQTLKSIRTGLVIGTLTTLIMLPFAILLGISAGYFGRRVDDIIQYIYTTLSSIPGVLLIAAAILSLQVFIGRHPEWFHTLAERADARLLALCVILGVTSWTGLCRLLRGETLKVREIDFVKAGKALGSSRVTLLLRHILPNVMHIVLIAVVLDFSGLVLAEAVLSYVGVGVDPSAISWGNMINSARLELAREPLVWWPLLAAFIFMFLLVLAANLFADAVRDGFDPRVKD